MLTYFPAPYPGEWWYSVLCRYHVRSGHSKHATTISDLYGGHPMVHGRLIPGGDCAAILSKLPPGGLSIDDVLANHTLLPYYTRFLLQTRSSRYGRHYGLAVDQVLPMCGHRCQMVWRDSNTARCVIRQIQHSMGSQTGAASTRYLYSLCVRSIKSRSYLFPSSLQGCLSYFYLLSPFAVRILKR